MRIYVGSSLDRRHRASTPKASFQWAAFKAQLSETAIASNIIMVNLASMDAPIFARDMDLVRSILIWAEQGGAQGFRPQPETVALCHHVKIMVDAGFVEGEGKCYKIPGSDEWEPGIAHVKAITWKGSEFLAAVQNEALWRRAKAQLSNESLPVLFDLLRDSAKNLLKEGTTEPGNKEMEEALCRRSADLAKCGDQFLETLTALRLRGQNDIETIWNAAFHVSLVDNDLSACLYFSTTTGDVWSKRTIARTLAVMLVEAGDDFLQLFGKPFIDACKVAGVFDEFEQLRREVCGKVRAFNKEHGAFLRDIRINSGAHKDHDAVEFIRSVGASDPDKLNDLACRFMDLLKGLGRFSMAVISRTTALYRERGVIQ